MKWSHYALLAGFSAVLPVAAQAQGTEEATAAAAPTTDERVVLEADTVYESSADNTIVAEGNVEALYQGRTLRADRLIYDRTTERARASGNVVIIAASSLPMRSMSAPTSRMAMPSAIRPGSKAMPPSRPNPPSAALMASTPWSISSTRPALSAKTRTQPGRSAPAGLCWTKNRR
nr:hypothetical protein [Hyphomonas sp. 34-62-18]